VQSALSDTRLIVELVGVIATYNMVSRFLVALQVELE
jgi:alkylhydroperoxidase family enzyme